MPRVSLLRSLTCALLLLLPALPLAYLCRGRTPTRFDARNLPAWERQANAARHINLHPRRIGRLRTTLKHKTRSVT